MADFEMKRGDRAPSLIVTLKDRLGQPVDLSLASGVQFAMRSISSATNTNPAVTGAMTIAADQTADRGQVTYDWIAGDTDTAGPFNAEFVVTWGTGGREQTFPTAGYVSIQINDDLEAHAMGLRLAAALGDIRPAPRKLDTTPAAAEATIRRKTAADSAPVLTAAEVAALVALALRPDGTYATNRAAAEGWRWKMGKVAGGFSFSADGVQVDKTMLLEHCRKMSVMYSRGQVRTVHVDTAVTPFERVWPQ